MGQSNTVLKQMPIAWLTQGVKVSDSDAQYERTLTQVKDDHGMHRKL
jgi:hypothetical protein